MKKLLKISAISLIFVSLSGCGPAKPPIDETAVKKAFEQTTSLKNLQQMQKNAENSAKAIDETETAEKNLTDSTSSLEK